MNTPHTLPALCVRMLISMNVLWLAACGLAVTSATAHAEHTVVSIFVPYPSMTYTSFYYEKRGVTKDYVLQQMDAALRGALPCAEVLSAHDIRVMLEFNKMQHLFSGGSDDLLQEIGGGIGADYLLSTSFGNEIDEHHWRLGVSLIPLRKGYVSVMFSEVGQGDAGNVLPEMIKRAMNEIGAAGICPWHGTITMTKKGSRDTVSTEVTKQELSSTTTTETHAAHSSESWTIEAVGRRHGKTTGRGTVAVKADSLHQFDRRTTGNVPCFRAPENCAITDERMPGTFDHYLNYEKSQIRGSRNFDGMKITVTFQADSAFVSLEGEPFGVGKGVSEAYEVTENSCDKCVRKNEKGEYTGAAWGGMYFGGPGTDSPRETTKVDRVTGSNGVVYEYTGNRRLEHQVSGNQKFTDELGTVTEISWDLRR